MFLTKFIYDLTGTSEPTVEELDDEIDRLLLKKSAEEPSHLVPPDQMDQVGAIDSEVISYWIRRRFEPVLILLLLGSEDNYQQARAELRKMSGYNSQISKLFRCNFVERQAMQRVREACFDDSEEPNLKRIVSELKRTLNLLSKHFETGSSDLVTLQGTELYTTSDVTLYNYLKRILVGRYKDLGLKSHLKLCDPLINFMRLYAKKNPHVIDITNIDPLETRREETSLLADITKPAIFALGLITFFLWRNKKVVLPDFD